MVHKTEEFVPRLLTYDQKQRLIAICTELIQLAVDDKNFLSRTITGDENWIYVIIQ